MTSGISTETEPAVPIIEVCIHFPLLYDASMIDRKRFWMRSIIFEISIGNAGNKQFGHSQCFDNDKDIGNQTPDQRPEFESQTMPRYTGTLDGKYNYVPLGSRKPCLYVKSWWPNLEWRMHNSNYLTFIANFLEEKLEKLEGMVALESADAYIFYNAMICNLNNYCLRYLDMLDTGRYDHEGGTTKLDRYRVNFCRNEIENILKRIKINGQLPNNNYIRIAMVHGYQYLGKLKKLREDQLSIFPKQETTVETNETNFCLFFTIVPMLLTAACWSSIPPGYNVNHEQTIYTFPKYLEYTHSTVVKQTLDPFWDQTLILPPRTVHGSKEYIKLNPPIVILEVYDLDICGIKEFCGRCTAIPLVKLAEETYSPPDFPPKLGWYKFKSQRDFSGSVLAAFELIEVKEEDEDLDKPIHRSMLDTIYTIPEDIRPKMASYRLEIIFWGMRDMKKLYYMPVMNPRIIIECGGVDIKSEVMRNVKKFSNFKKPHVIIELDMPELEIYYPSVVIKAFDSRGLGCFKYVGICIIPSINIFLEQLITEDDYEEQIYGTKKIFKPVKHLEEKPETVRVSLGGKQVYDGELEMQPQFSGFQDRLRTFELWKGRKSEEPDYDSENYVGKFKGRICVYRWPHPSNLPCKTRSGRSASDGLCDDYPHSESIKLVVRLYVVKGINLQPQDPLTGKSDPYICIRLGKTYISDQKNYIPNQLNPTFGRFFEIEAVFPRDCTMIVQVWDYDATTTDDLIGETKIDIESRFYSKHRATCGISKIYATEGYNQWRDREKPTQILEQLCRKNNLPLPEYRSHYVKIGRKRFPFDEAEHPESELNECMALSVLHQWQNFPICGCYLVPEHVERRPLFNIGRPGLEQGRLEMWIDMFQVGEVPLKPPVDISPPVPEEYEIRVIVWNTEDIPLVESQFLTGEKCSDIYVKGWITYDDYQKTDIHYNSLNGEGNFNWRFVFRVMYCKSERVIIVPKKISIFSLTDTEEKLPCRLYLQVWDSDHFSPDDFLGALTLDLSAMPRGSPNSKNCTLKLLNPNLPTINLFKVTRVKAWWPFEQSVNAGQYIQAGKIEMEISILKAEEADENPAGRGRDPPQELPPPNRPETSFSWFLNPWKAFRYVVCRYYRWRIICCIVCLLLLVLGGCAIYAFPGYMVKRLLGA
ncbi:otoferlin-like [Apis laboriosa]|uniref:otoferlin-like n=2 Tax=Apis TaxID=7459 RepID=UPI001CC6690A|nr:otoferlin-like [Apis laboriosa]